MIRQTLTAAELLLLNRFNAIILLAAQWVFFPHEEDSALQPAQKGIDPAGKAGCLP
jgi:hypothetical protein